MCKNFTETDSSIHEKIRKSRALGTNKQVPSSSICKYNLFRTVDTLSENLYCPGKVGRLLQVQKLRYRKCIYRKKGKCVSQTKKKRERRSFCCSLDRAKFQDLAF